MGVAGPQPGQPGEVAVTPASSPNLSLALRRALQSLCPWSKDTWHFLSPDERAAWLLEPKEAGTARSWPAGGGVRRPGHSLQGSGVSPGRELMNIYTCPGRPASLCCWESWSIALSVSDHGGSLGEDR
jgi:hypothetical protein